MRRDLQGTGLLPTFRIALDPALAGTPAEQAARPAIKALAAELAHSPGWWLCMRTAGQACTAGGALRCGCCFSNNVCAFTDSCNRVQVLPSVSKKP